MADWKPNIFEYMSYRAYLRDYYTRAKDNVARFSFRKFSELAGFKSSNFIKLVMDGNRNLGEESIDPLCDAMGLDRGQTRFFRNLVAFEQAANLEERNAAYRRLSSSKHFIAARHIEHNMFEYLSAWYNPAIRELAGRADFEATPEWIAPRLLPPVSEEQVERSLELLFALGMLVRDEDGRVHRGEPSMMTGHEIGALAIGNYHRQMMERAVESILNVPHEHRDISALTVTVRQEQVAELKSRIHAFREQLLEYGAASEGGEVVYQLNIQLFPLSQQPKTEPS
jgi:uncharacterized protein (TIGR02147 family)